MCSVADGSLQTLQRDYQTKVFTLQRLRTQLEEMEKQRKENATQLEKYNTQLNVSHQNMHFHHLVASEMLDTLLLESS